MNPIFSLHINIPSIWSISSHLAKNQFDNSFAPFAFRIDDRVLRQSVKNSKTIEQDKTSKYVDLVCKSGKLIVYLNIAVR